VEYITFLLVDSKDCDIDDVDQIMD